MNYSEDPETIKLFIATLIRTCTLLLTSCIVRYQHAHEQLFGKSIHKRTKDQGVSSYYKDVLIGLLDKTSPQVEEEDLKPSAVPGIENLVEEVPQVAKVEVPKVSVAPPICTPIMPVAPPSAPTPPSVVSSRSIVDNVADAVVDTVADAVADKILTKASVDTVVDAVAGTVSSEVDIEVPKSSTPPICTPNIPVAPPPPNPSSGGVVGDIVVATPNIPVAPPPPNPSSGGVEGDIVVANTSIVVANTSSSRKTITIEDMNRKFDRDLYFWNSTEHSYLGGGFTNPSMKKDKGDYDKWQIKRIDDQPDVVEEHNQVIIIRRNVAICHVATGKYLSCRRWCFFTNSALAEFRKNRDEFESFEMIYASDNSCIFKSHNDLFLSINQTFYTGAFKSCRNRDGDDGRPLQGRWNCKEAFAQRGIKDTAGRIIIKFASMLWAGKSLIGAMAMILESVLSIGVAMLQM